MVIVLFGWRLTFWLQRFQLDARCNLGSKLPPGQLDLYRAIDEVLFRDWDPIGVAQWGDDARDEYHAYLPQAFQFALRDDEAGLAHYLTGVTTERMGLLPRPQADRAIAASIIKIKIGMESGRGN